MDLSSLSSDPNFFGKDSVTLFIGQVEDVNDPKRSGRVKVRCLGWHPPERQPGQENSLPTDDLPWTRTCLPVTGAQQMRSGTKHGLLPGSWVMGVFTDGNEANDGYAFCTFNFTAKSVEENNRVDVDISDGRIPNEIDGKPLNGFTKINAINDGIYPNTGLNTKEELTTGKDDKGDIAHDSAPLDSSSDGICDITESGFATTVKEVKTASNQHSQDINSTVADGLCGSLNTARDIISAKIKEKLPSDLVRIVEGDDLFDINGNAINLNGILRVLSGDISSLLKETIQTQKAFLQKTVNKELHSIGIFSSSTRSPLTGQLADLAFSTQFDIFNSIIDKSLDLLEDLVLNSLQNINNQQKSSKGGSNNTGELGTSRSTLLVDLNPIYLADSVINDVEVNYRKKEKEAQEECEELVRPMKEKMSAYERKMSNMLLEDYACQEDMEDDIKNDYDDIVKDISDLSSDGGGGFDLGEAAQFLSMALNMDFTMVPQLFNKSGLAVLDSFTSIGCNPHALYNTVTGIVGSSSGSSGGGEGGGSESGKSSKRYNDTYKSTGFGGRPGRAVESETTYNTFPDEVKTVKVKQRRRKNILNSIPTWQPVDFYEVNRQYELKGEVKFGDIDTRQSRVLVNNQEDPTDNGIYVTHIGTWKRAEDANFSTDYKKRKLVEAKNLPVGENLYYYSNKNNPKLRYDNIEFKSIVESNDFTNEEKKALDKKVDSEADGTNASVFVTSRPSGEEEAALNYINGRPNTPIIANPGVGYFFESKKAGRNFPSIFIEGYVGTPVPVVDRNTGELVTVLINQRSFSNKANPSITIIPDDSSIGIVSDSSNYDIYLSHFYVQNTGVGYGPDTEIIVTDKEWGTQSAVVRPKIVDGRIVSVEVINNGSGFKRIPNIKIKGKGKRAKLYPIMGLKVKESNPSVKKLQQNVNLSLTPSTVNLYTTLDL